MHIPGRLPLAFIGLTLTPMVLSTPVAGLEQRKVLHERQTPMPWVFNGTCTVSTNICAVEWWLSNPPRTANYVCGRYVTLGYTSTDPAKACPSDGHVGLFFPSAVAIH